VGEIDSHSSEEFCYLTTRGRITGRPHEIEIWFVVRDGLAYVMAGGGRNSDWVRNLMADEQVTLRVGDRSFRARAHVITGDDDSIRRQMAAKYQGWEEGRALSDWAQTALIVEVAPERDH
jgi:deazaflavin-dependent oxidoreductase (nitroreductase family)